MAYTWTNGELITAEKLNQTDNKVCTLGGEETPEFPMTYSEMHNFIMNGTPVMMMGSGMCSLVHIDQLQDANQDPVEVLSWEMLGTLSFDAHGELKKCQTLKYFLTENGDVRIGQIEHDIIMLV